MEVIINTEGAQTTVGLVGRLDTPAAQDVSAALVPVMEKASGTTVLDCGRLEYISSSGLRIFLTLRKEAASKGGRVIVRGMSGDIRGVFMMTGFLNLFEIED